MPYSAIVHQVLIATPSDIASSDVQLIGDVIMRWNGILGLAMGAAVVPLHWQVHAVPEHGRRPQESLNLQLLSKADAVIAVFWHRLGSPTGVEVSGTVEEIRRAHEAGKYVAVLRCERPYPPGFDRAQLQQLDDFLEYIKEVSLCLTYDSELELTQRVDAILTQLVTRDSERAALLISTTSGETHAAEVWARVDQQEHVDTDSRGRLQTRRNYYVVLHNTGDLPAHDVRFELEAEDGEQLDLPHLIQDERPIEVLAPNAEARYPIAMHMQTAHQARCIVNWKDQRGDHQHLVTLRFL